MIWIVVLLLFWIAGVSWFAYAFLQPSNPRVVYASRCESPVGFCGWYRVDYHRRRVSVVLRTRFWPPSVVFWVRDMDPTQLVYAGFVPTEDHYRFVHERVESESAWRLLGLRQESAPTSEGDDTEGTVVTLVYRIPPGATKGTVWSHEALVRTLRIETTFESSAASENLPVVPIAQATDRALHARVDEDVSCEGAWVPRFDGPDGGSRCYQGRRTDVYRVTRAQLNEGTPCPYADGDQTYAPCDDDV